MVQLILRVAFLTAMSVAFCGLTAVLGSAPLFVLRNNEGRGLFFVAVAAATAVTLACGAYTFAVPFLLSALLVYVFIESAEMGASLLKAGFTALTFGSGVSILAVAFVAKQKGFTVAEYLHDQIQAMLASVPQIKETFPIDVDSLTLQLPSALLILMSLSLWIGILFGKKFSTLKGNSAFAKIQLRNFDLPDGLVWFLTLSVAGAFLPKDSSAMQTIALNAFNFLLFLYFLKGIALVSLYFHVARVSTIWQTILYVIFVSHLFWVLSVFGLIDVWLNFRMKLLKKQSDNHLRGES